MELSRPWVPRSSKFRLARDRKFNIAHYGNYSVALVPRWLVSNQQKIPNSSPAEVLHSNLPGQRAAQGRGCVVSGFKFLGRPNSPSPVELDLTFKFVATKERFLDVLLLLFVLLLSSILFLLFISLVQSAQLNYHGGELSHLGRFGTGIPPIVHDDRTGDSLNRGSQIGFPSSANCDYSLLLLFLRLFSVNKGNIHRLFIWGFIVLPSLPLDEFESAEKEGQTRQPINFLSYLALLRTMSSG